MVRVLHFAGTINRHDFIDTVIRFADRRRFHMMACTYAAESDIEPPRFDGDGLSHFVLGVRGRRDYPRAIAQLAGLLRRERVDVLHTHHYDEAFVGTVAAGLARTPAVVVGRHYHDEIYLLTGGLKRRSLLALEGFVNRRARTVVVPSAPIRTLLVERQNVPAERVRVIPYGFDFHAERYRPPTQEEDQAVRREWGLEDRFVVGNFGRHHRLKGQAYLLRAFARFVRAYPDARLLLVGDGPDHRHLRRLAQDLGLTEPEGSARCVFAGWRKDACRVMAAVDVVVHPTLHEAFPQVMVEAMALAKPLVITPAAGPGDQIQHGQTGLLVPMRDADALYGALVWVRTHPAEARAVGERARAYVLGALDIRSVVRQHEAVYEQCVG